mgnify:FL=1
MCVCQNNKKYLNSILDDLEIEPYQKKIIAKRYLKQVSFYAGKAKSSEIFYLFLSIFVTICTILLPALLSIQQIDYSDDEEEDKEFKQRVYWGTWIISLLITISNGLLQFLNLQKQFVSFNQTKERLLAEGWHYIQLSGNYKDRTHQSSFIDFCDEIEKIKKSQVNKELMFITESTEKKDKGIYDKSSISGKEIKIIPPIEKEVKTKLDNIMIEIDNKTFSQL